MAIPGTQALVAAFSFGFVVNAASAGLFIYVKGHGSSIFRDGLRLVLIIFFISSALWAQIAFLATIINDSAGSTCQVALIFTMAFDQLGRAAMEQYLLWAMPQLGNLTIGQMVPQLLLLGRLVVGAIFIGFTRSDSALICAPVSSLLPVAIVTIVFDVIIIAALGVRAFSSGMYDDMRAKKDGAAKNKAVLLTLVGFSVWTAASIPMLLGMAGVELLLRTAVPAAGLVILIGIVTTSAGNVVTTRSMPSRYPEAPSPREIPGTRELQTSDSDYPPSNYEDVKDSLVRMRTGTSNISREAENPVPLPNVNGAVTGIVGFGGLPVQGQLFPPMRAETEPLGNKTAVSMKTKRAFFDIGKGGGGGSVRVGKLAISGPMLQQNGDDENNPLRKIATVDLATAAQNEKERRQGALENMQREPDLVARRPAPPPQTMAQRAKTLKRKEVPSTGSSQVAPATELEPKTNMAAATTSAQLSPSPRVGEEMRRRSPRQAPEAIKVEAARPETPPRSPLRLVKQNQSPPRPPRPESLNIDGPVSPFIPRQIATVLQSPRQARQPPLPPRLVPLPLESPRKAPQPPPLPTQPPKTPLSPRQPPPPSPSKRAPDPASALVIASDSQATTLDQLTEETNTKPLERNLAAPKESKRMTRGAAFPIRPVSRKPSPPPIESYGIVIPEEGVPQVAESTKLPVKGFQGIRPSRKYTDPEPVLPEPTKTPLQRRPTNGLPSNPRAQAMKTIAGEVSNQKEQTVMFINNIQYNNPMEVQDIINEVSAMSMAKEAPQSANSVVHRPRPIRRKPEEDPVFFPAQTSPHGHRRTKSGGSIASKKSILQSNPGSPTGLPPLPPPPSLPANPRSARIPAGNPERPLPNDTKSMTFDEKMTLLFPAPPTSGNVNARRSSVPEMPQVPVAYLEIATSPVESATSDGEHLINRQSKATSRFTRASIRTQDILGGNEINGIDRHLPDRNTVNTRSFADEDGTPWLSGTAPKFDRYARPSMDGINRRSSPVIPARISSASGFSDVETHCDEMTNWGSLHSPVKAVYLPQARLNPRTTFIKRDLGRRIPSAISGTGTEDGEVMTIMLDVDSQKSGMMSRGSWYLDESANTLPSQHHGSQWHRRVGDECPTFSDRREKTRSRKMVPPTPLLLNGAYSQKTIIVQETEPSPIESPSETLETIQEQLRRFEDPNSDSTDNRDLQRMTLLQNLEQEMGVLDNKWSEMHNELQQRDSMSSVRTESRRESLVAPRSKASLAAERRASRRSQLQGRAASKSTWSTHTSQSSESTHASIQQVRLEVAQDEYLHNTPTEKRGLNFLSVSKALAQSGSPTPPDTDEYDSDNDILAHRVQSFIASKTTALLWTPTSPPQDEPVSSMLWNAPTKSANLTAEAPELPGLSVRPVLRKSVEPLNIESWELWRKGDLPKDHEYNGLWRVHSKQRVTAAKDRPVTQRPPRRSRRITLLPDILESPEPLPNNRGTLGIFQFPWGEKSDTATIQARIPIRSMYMAMPGTMASGGPALNPALEVRSKQLEEEEEYSSFFEDYEEDDGLEVSGSDSDEDDFDETTLWEIASLLNTNVPSKSSFISGQMNSDSVVDDYLVDIPSDVEEDETDTSFLHEEDTAAIAPLKTNRLGFQERSLSTLWVQKSEAQVRTNMGLPQPDDWLLSIPSSSDTLRPPTRRSELAFVESDSLWAPTSKISEKPSTESLWSMPIITSYPSLQELAQPLLWAGKTEVKARLNKGLPQPDDWMSSNPTGLKTLRPPTRQSEPTSVKSNTLWAPPAKVAEKSPTNTLWFKSIKTLKVSKLWPGKSERKVIPRKGLPQPDDATWKSYQSTGESSRSPPRKSDLEVVESTELWQPAPTEVAKALSVSLWSQPNVSKNEMWSKTVKKVRYSKGLPQPDEKTWKSYQPIGDGIRSPPRMAKLETIQSKELWQSTSQTKGTKTGGLWSRPRAQAKMWTKPVNITTTSRGLPQPDQETWEFYLPTSNHPRSPPRMAEPEQLESADLWQPLDKPVQKQQVDTLWSLSSLPKKGSTKYQPNAETQPQLTVRATRVASLWEQPTALEVPSTAQGMFTVDPTRTDFRSTNKEPAAKQMVRKPRPSDAAKPLDKLTSNNLWPSRTSKSGSHNWISESISTLSVASSRRPIRMMHPKPVAFHADWDAALSEAIALSYPKVIRPAASEADWDVALSQAIILSYPKIPRPTATPADWDTALAAAIAASKFKPTFDISVKHPVFAASSLITKSEWFHPAATGYTYDVAIVHPSFFGSLAVDTTVPIEHIHPAISSYAARKIRRAQRSASKRKNPKEVPTPAPTQETPVQVHPTPEPGATYSPTHEDQIAPSRSLSHSPSGSNDSSDSRRSTRERSQSPNHSRSSSLAHKAMIMAQIQALEQEKEFAAQYATDSRIYSEPEALPGAQAVQKQNQQLWSKDVETAPLVGDRSMWAPTHTRGASGTPEIIYGEPETEEEKARRRARSQKRKEICAQIMAIEEGTNPASFATARSDTQQGLWSRRNITVDREGGEKNWLSDSSKKITSKVVLRY